MTDWTVQELVNLAETHYDACRRGDREHYARKRAVAFGARKFARSKLQS